MRVMSPKISSSSLKSPKMFELVRCYQTIYAWRVAVRPLHLFYSGECSVFCYDLALIPCDAFFNVLLSTYNRSKERLKEERRRDYHNYRKSLEAEERESQQPTARQRSVPATSLAIGSEAQKVIE